MAFRYLNVNPNGEHTEDCVCRAISLASGYDYHTIEDKLYLIAELYECEELCLCCYSYLLNDVFKYPKVFCEDMSVADFADIYNRGIYLVRMAGHISTVIDGDWYDIWNCGSEILTDAWRVLN